MGQGSFRIAAKNQSYFLKANFKKEVPAFMMLSLWAGYLNFLT
jgi:hypothetical protein